MQFNPQYVLKNCNNRFPAYILPAAYYRTFNGNTKTVGKSKKNYEKCKKIFFCLKSGLYRVLPSSTDKFRG